MKLGSDRASWPSRSSLQVRSGTRSEAGHEVRSGTGPEVRSGTGPILLSQATFLLAHIANSGPVPFSRLLPEAEAFAITGDIGEAHDVAAHLRAFAELGPVYFVLGNHDFYRGSIAGVRAVVRETCRNVPNLRWMPDAGVVELTESTCLVGHDGWGDGRLGEYHGSDVMLNDFALIGEFDGFYEDPAERLAKLRALGDEAAAHFRGVLPEALARFRNVIVLTHVPPFRESCWHEGAVSDDNWLPFFTCKTVGDALRDAMAVAPDRQMTVLCGHTHSSGEAQILPNLRVLTGGAVYGKPGVQRVLEVE